MRSAILPALGYAGYPMIIVGAIAVFGLSSLVTLDMIRAQVEKSVVAPAAASADFNLPPVQQIGSLTPPRIEVEPPPPKEPESSIVAIAPPEGTVAVTLTAPDPSASSSIDAGALTGRIGSQAVNVRSGPSKTATTLGVLNAGTPVGIGENVGGWIHVSFNGGDGWVYKDYLETGSTVSIN